MATQQEAGLVSYCSYCNTADRLTRAMLCLAAREPAS